MSRPDTHIQKGVKSMAIFKAYDVRGLYPTEINREIAYKIGFATATYLGVTQIVVGHDMRLSADDLVSGLTAGITDAGVDVVDIGLCCTPAVYFTVGYYNYPAGIMTTASHNPAQYNGFKFCRENAIPMSYETGIGDIHALVEKGHFIPKPHRGRVITKDIWQDYRIYCRSFIKDFKPFKIVVDAGNGMGGLVVPLLFKDTPLTIIPLYFELDGSFPHHDANPLKEENMIDLIRAVKANGADCGIAFDGDADRVAFVDEQGHMVSGDMLSLLITEGILKKAPEAIIYDVRSSKIVPEMIRTWGGRPIESRVGHSFIKMTMRQEKAAFGGELSGHYYFRENFCCDSGDLAMIFALNTLSQRNQPLSQAIKPFQKYYPTGEINFEVADKQKSMNAIARVFHDADTIYYLDGISVKYPDFWFNVRPSNTEPVLRVNLEAVSADKRELYLKKVKEVLTEIHQ